VRAEVYTGMEFADYCALPGEHATSLRDALVSPLLYQHRQQQSRPDSDTLRLGRATHTAVLEPLRFLRDYVLWTDGRVRRGHEWDDFREAARCSSRTVLTSKQYDDALMIAESVRRHPVAARLLAEGKPELSIAWAHERTLLLCKARPDWLGSALVELKTCRDPSPGMFAAQFVRLGYHLQAGMYNAAVLAAGLGPRPVKVIAAQNVPPFDVVVYDVPLDVLIVGEMAYETALDKVAACRRTKSWPGIAHDAEVELHLPAWAVPDYDDDPNWSVTEVTNA
jgi:hypothetical protein